MAWYIIQSLSCPPPSSTSCHISCSQLCMVEEWCVQGMGGPASREAWSGHSTTSLEATRAAMVPLSPSPIWPPHHYHPSLPKLPARPCACCSLSRYNRARPRWLLLREQRESHLDHRRDWRGRRWTERRTEQMCFTQGQRWVKTEPLSTWVHWFSFSRERMKKTNW